ncbi:Rcr2p [Sugiyamaella lignohabitans]|uniref:Rcr2p n=1 Tax=Sugiyamaella lignohabitans TaxID=796027 RepID=A0A161HKZ5_9ASCO|nr:Rcr2p [Sugiyamaella lignohabitans]ANB13847.1 Rcr2p [Sugiyamaella lignohabitans]
MYLYLAEALLVRRDNNDDLVCDDEGDCYYNTPWYNYGRWLVVAAIAIVFAVSIYLMRRNAANRLRGAMAPLSNRGWTWVPPTYHQSQRDYSNTTQAPPAAPPYNRSLGTEDAGYYDSYGNFIQTGPVHTVAPPTGPPPPPSPLSPVDSSGVQIPPPVLHHPSNYEMRDVYPSDRKSPSVFTYGPFPEDRYEDLSGPSNGSSSDPNHIIHHENSSNDPSSAAGGPSFVELGGASVPPVDDPEHHLVPPPSQQHN